jgi:NAD(P)-dependent dehydrogenase (short-subunit alcohol dehydrogenase family)
MIRRPCGTRKSDGREEIRSSGELTTSGGMLHATSAATPSRSRSVHDTSRTVQQGSATTRRGATGRVPAAEAETLPSGLRPDAAAPADGRDALPSDLVPDSPVLAHGPAAPAPALTPEAPVTPSVLVTGASKGIGAACALHLARRGWRVYAGVRTEGDAAATRARHDAITPVLLDITDAGQIAAAARQVEEAQAGQGLAALVNNAGLAVAGPLEFIDLSELRRQLEVNVVGQVAVTQAFMPLLRRGRAAGARRSDGRVVFMSSVSGRSALPFIGPYGASKFALEALADALRIELRPFGIGVVLVEPGVISTPIWDTSAERTREAIASWPPQALEYYGGVLASIGRWTTSRMGGLPADRVARVVERALTARSPRPRYVVGLDARARIAFEAVLPARLRDWLIHQGVKRLARHDP